MRSQSSTHRLQAVLLVIQRTRYFNPLGIRPLLLEVQEPHDIFKQADSSREGNELCSRLSGEGGVSAGEMPRRSGSRLPADCPGSNPG